MTLKGKVAIVTGGNSGIGKAVVLALAAEGASIVIDYVADEAATEALEQQVRDLGDQVTAVKADVSKIPDLETLIGTAVKTFGRLDIMVNNAGIETRTSVLDTTEAEYEKVLDINLKSAFFGTQLAAKQMIAQGSGGRIINMTSVHEDWPMPGNTAYCLSKGGMRMLTRTAGVELAPHNILVVGVGSRCRRHPDQRGHRGRSGGPQDPGRGDPHREAGQARGDRQRGDVPGRSGRQLPDGHHHLRRRRHHAEQSRALTDPVRRSSGSRGPGSARSFENGVAAVVAGDEGHPGATVATGPAQEEALHRDRIVRPPPRARSERPHERRLQKPVAEVAPGATEHQLVGVGRIVELALDEIGEVGRRLGDPGDDVGRHLVPHAA